MAGVDGGSDWEKVRLRGVVEESWRGLSGPASALEAVDADADADADARGHRGNVDDFIARLMQDSAEDEPRSMELGLGLALCVACAVHIPRHPVTGF